MNNKIILTKHAKQRMNERGISIQNIQEAIEFPDYTISKRNKIESHKKINDKVLKVVYLKPDKFIKIITLMWK